MKGHADDQRIGLPLAHPRLDLRQPGVAVGTDGGLWRGRPQQAIADGNASTLGAKIKSQERLEVVGDFRHGRQAHA